MAVWAVVVLSLLAVLAVYVMTSLFFFTFPQLLHQRKTVAFAPRHISHRGGAAEKLENTMTAFRHAVSLGSQMLEVDCHVTKDGQVVVTHDVSLLRTCGVDRNVADFCYEQLPQVKSCLTLDFNSYHQVTGEDRRIPLLRDVFEAFPDLPINVDVEADDDRLIHEVNVLIQEYRRESITPWGTHDDAIVKRLYRKNPSVPLIFSERRARLLVLLFYTGLLPFVPLKESLLEVIMPTVMTDKLTFEKELSWWEKFQYKVMDFLLMRPSLFDHLRKRGIHTYFWVLNTEAEFRRAFRMGASGIMTDCPTLLADYLDRHQPGWR